MATPNFAQMEKELAGIAAQFAGIYAITQQLNSAVGMFREMQVELTNSLAAAGGLTTQFGELESAARNFALATTYSASQVASAFYDIASAGFNVQQTISAATGVILLAQATMTELGKASDLVANAIDQFNLSSTDSVRIANLFVAASNQSLATVSKLQAGLKQVGPIAHEMGLSIEQTVGLLDELYNAGLRGQQAGTALRNALLSIEDPLGKGNLLLQNLGVTMYDTTGKVRPALDVLKELANLNLSQSDIAQLAGRENAVGFQTLLNSLKSTGSAASAAEEAIQKLTGTMAAFRQAELQMNTLNGAMAEAKHHFDDLKIQLAEELSPALIKVLNGFSDMVDVFRHMDDASRTLVVQLVLGAAGVALFGGGLLSVFPALVAMGKGLGNIATASIAARNAFTAFNAGLSATGIRAAATASTELAAGLGTLIASTAGMIAFGVAIFGVVTAIAALQKAASDRKLHDALTSIYADYGNNNPGVLGKTSVSDFADATDHTAALAKTLQDADNLTPIAKDGSGATNRVAYLNQILAEQNQELARLSGQADALRSATATTLPKLREAYKSLGVIDTLFSQNLELGRSSEGFAQSQAALLAISQSNAQNRTLAIQVYLNAEIDAISKIPGISDSFRSKLLSEAQQSAVKLASVDGAAYDNFVKYLQQEYAKHEKALNGTDLSVSDKASLLSDVVSKALNDAEKNTEVDLQKVEAQQQAQQAKIKGLIALTQGKLSAANASVLTEVQSIAARTANLNPQQQKALADLIATDPALRDKVIHDIDGSSEGSLRAMQDIFDELRLKRGIIVNYTTERLRTAVTPLINPVEMDHAAKQAQLEGAKALLRLREINGTATLPFVQGIAATEKSLATDTAITNLEAELSQNNTTKDAADKLVIAARKPGSDFVDSLNKAFDQYKGGIGKADSEAIEKVGKILTEAGINVVPTVKSAIVVVGEKLGTAKRRADADVATFIKSQQKDRFGGIDRALADLPNDDELKAQLEKLQETARYALTTFLGSPWDAVAKAADDQQRSFDKQKADIQKSFQKTYTELVKGIKDALDPGNKTKQDLQDAFSGKTFSEILDTGSAQAFGQTLTKENFFKVVEDHFEALVAGSENAPKRIEEFKKRLQFVIAQMSAVYDGRKADLEILAAKQHDVQTEMAKIAADVHAQSLTTLASALNQSGQTSLGLQVGVKAQAAVIAANGTDTLTAIQQAYTKSFGQLGVDVKPNSDGTLTVPIFTAGFREQDRPLVDELYKEANDALKAQQLVNEHSKTFWNDENSRVISAANQLADYAKLWEATGGAVVKANTDIAKAQADAAKARFDVSVIGHGDIFTASRDNEVAQVEAERRSRIEQIDAALKKVGATDGQIATVEAQINATYEKRIALMGQANQLADRAAYAAAAQQEAAEHNGIGSAGSQAYHGLIAGAQDAAAKMKTPFEVAMDGASSAVTGFAQTAGNAIAGVSGDWRQATADILKNIAAQIAQMIILQTVMQALRAFGLPFGSGGVGGAGQAPGFLPADLPPLRYGGVAQYAFGGAHASSGMLLAGGVMPPKSARMAIFGEGDLPEAFIPMMDRRTVGVYIGADGKAVIPLPSGHSIPVSILDQPKPKTFAQGGVGGNAAFVDLMTARVADQVSSMHVNTVNQPPATVNHNTNYGGISISVTHTGNATPEDSEQMGKLIAKHVSAALDAHQAEQERKMARQGGLMRGSYKGIRYGQ